MKTILELGKTPDNKNDYTAEKTKPLWMHRDITDRKRIHLAGLGDVG